MITLAHDLYGLIWDYIANLVGRGAPGKTNGSQMGNGHFKVRLRVRLSKPFTTTVMSRTLSVGPKEVTIEAQEKSKSLEDATWIILRAGGFSTEAEAREYGQQLKVLTELAGICDRLGIDVGLDKATSWMNEAFARETGLIKPDERMAPNIHGILVLPDDNKTRIPLVNATGKVTASFDQFSEALIALGNNFPVDTSGIAKGVRLLNLALMTNEPVAQLALAISAIEELGQGEKWSAAQQNLIDDMVAKLEADPIIGAEGVEVAEAMRRSLHRVGLRQGVKRVLEKIVLNHLLKEWDRIYALRSAIFHGVGDLSSIDLGTLATESVTLCATVILTAGRQSGLKLPEVSSVHFPALKESQTAPDK